MIAVDTSALMAIILGEPTSDACIQVLAGEDSLLISAGIVAEALIVAGRRGVAEEMAQLLDGLGFEVVSLTQGSTRRVAQAYDRWGKGVHKASLNFGDCFAYELAASHGCKLLFVGDDFTATDIASALVAA